MTQDQIERLARECGDAIMDARGRESYEFDYYGLARLVALVQAAERERAEKLAAWLQWCLDNCDDSPEHNFGTTAADHMRALLAGKPAPMPGN